ncbi:hypothetical protein DXH78_02050 [Undibacter mobilis]|uniref:Uncharacterized protein n=2 Tax=Undibacter mobilis TaxID=2292256 RepID=A0A371B795_9BRAD|nr:hypothetical protein DXH78_02050 [Undibacter mobilis]
MVAGLLAGMWSQPALAQGRKPFHAMSNDEKNDVKTAESVDAQYRNALARTSKGDAKPVQVDPWSNMRGAETSPAKKK